jgi:hypothetical protein
VDETAELARRSKKEMRADIIASENRKQSWSVERA